MRCEKCGCELPEGAMFCLKCGESVSANTVHNKTNINHQEHKRENEENRLGVDYNETTLIKEQQKQEQKNQEQLEKEDILESGEQPIDWKSAGNRQESIFCPNCGVKNKEDDAYCFNCGFSFKGDNIEEKQGNIKSNTLSHQPDMVKTPKKRKGKIVALVAVAAILVVGGTVLIKGFTGGKVTSAKPITYVKNLGLYAVDINKKEKEAVKYTETLSNSASNIDITSVNYSEDGRYVFYPANISAQEENNSSYDLYCRNMKKDSEQPLEIDSSVIEYQLLPDNSLIYKKGDTNTVYIHDLENKSKVASDVTSYFIDSNNKYILWNESSGLDNEKTILYYQELNQKNDKSKIDSDINYIGASKDFSKIAFLKENNLYVIHNFGEKEKIASDITKVIASDIENEKFYCIKESKNTRLAMDFVDDDYASLDYEMQEPDQEDFMVEKVEKEDGRYTVNKEIDEDAYSKAYDEYLEKKDRDRLREELEDYEIEEEISELYYCEKGIFEKIDEGYRDTLNKIQTDIKALVYTKEDVEGTANIKLSNLLEDSDSSWSEKISKLRSGSKKTCLAIGLNTFTLKDTKLTYGTVYDEKSKMVYGISETEKGNGNLVSVKTDGEFVGTVKLIQENVNNLEKIIDGDIYYTANANGYKGDLYKNGEVIDYDVLPYSVKQFENQKYITYITDFSEERAKYTLKSYNDKDTKVVADDVLGFIVRSPKEIVLLVDFSMEHETGDLKLYTGDKNLELLDTEVSYLVGITKLFD